MFSCFALQIDTKNILFICGGAFVDLEKTISERLSNILSFIFCLYYHMFYILKIFPIFPQATWFFNWFPSTGSLKYAYWWCNKCWDHIFAARISEWTRTPGVTSISIICWSVTTVNFFFIYIVIWMLFLQVESGDLIAYGLIPEFVGRFPILVSLSSLSEDQLVEVT
jgi:hypothetical protein